MDIFLPVLGIVVLVVAWFVFVAWNLIDGSSLLAAVVGIVGLAIIFTFIVDSEKPPTGQAKWKGGKGPATVCWYADEDDPDTVVSTGKSTVVVDGGSSRYTYCSKDGKNLPDGVR